MSPASETSPSLHPWLAPQRRPLPHLRPGEEAYCWIGGFVPNGDTFDSLLVGMWERRGLRFVGFLRKEWLPGEKEDLFARIREIPLGQCPFYNLPAPEQPHTAVGELAQCRWLFPSQRISVRQEDLVGHLGTEASEQVAKVA